jgi:hypothetical protein
MVPVDKTVDQKKCKEEDGSFNPKLVQWVNVYSSRGVTLQFQIPTLLLNLILLFFPILCVVLGL